MSESEFKRSVSQIFKFISEWDLFGEVSWNQEFEFVVLCNDLFWWGTADVEPLTEESMDLMKKSMEDGGIAYGHLLYCARKRKMRPQGAYYAHIDKELHHLFDECGPKREINLGNPKGQIQSG